MCPTWTLTKGEETMMKKVLMLLNTIFATFGSIVMVFIILAVTTEMDFLDAGVIALFFGCSVALILCLGMFGEE